jgi:hypothetical protein
MRPIRTRCEWKIVKEFVDLAERPQNLFVGWRLSALEPFKEVL